MKEVRFQMSSTSPYEKKKGNVLSRTEFYRDVENQKDDLPEGVDPLMSLEEDDE